MTQDSQKLLAQAVEAADGALAHAHSALDALRGMLFSQMEASDDCAPKKEAAAWWRAGALAINRRGAA